MGVEELRARFSNCFGFKQSVVIPDQTRHDVWSLSPTQRCRMEHPGYEEQLLVLDERGTKIAGTAPAAALEVHYYLPDGGEGGAPEPDSGEPGPDR
jgi:hypothetical protein